MGTKKLIYNQVRSCAKVVVMLEAKVLIDSSFPIVVGLIDRLIYSLIPLVVPLFCVSSLKIPIYKYFSFSGCSWHG